MKLKLAARAARDLVEIGDYIANEQQNPRAAQKVLDRIEQALNRITDMPYIGRCSYVGDSREMTISSLPFTIVYRVVGDTIEVTTIFHEARHPDKK